MQLPSRPVVPRRGKVIVLRGQLQAIQPRKISLAGSAAQIWFDSHFRTLKQDCCCLDYSATRSAPGYMTLDYVRSGPKTTLKTFRGALLVLDEVARLRSALAIFAHVGTTAISDRLLLRWGWRPHAEKLSGRHWVKRFYDGYPNSDLSALGPAAAELSSLGH